MAAHQSEVLLSAARSGLSLARLRGAILGVLLLIAGSIVPATPSFAAAPALEPGVSLALARWRAAHYKDLRYALDLVLAPGSPRIEGALTLSLTLDNPGDDLILDWRGTRAEERVLDVTVNEAPVAARFEADHLVLPAMALRRGNNRITLRFIAPVGTSAGAITRYLDREDNAEYLYTLLVPADASTVFPVFDQPDLKARFTLSVTAPASWKVITNAPLVSTTPIPGQNRYAFAETEPISPYLFAFAAGPFEEVVEKTSALDPPPVRLFARKSRAARLAAEAPPLLALNRQAMDWFASYFDHPFPFAKYDLVLIPELAYGGMEHAGATFLREESVLFPFEPGTNDLLRRAQLLLHETCHQWFGNLVTMRWFDDLWLKEGFANLMAAKASAALLPKFPTWVAFHSLKTSAYRTDATRGTTPIKQPMTNLAAAKSAYGSIVYAKAPAVLWQAEYFTGENKFRDGVRAFIKSHAYGAAEWKDLAHALERASGEKLTTWGRAWVERSGMPRIRARPVTDNSGRASEIIVEQGAVAGGTKEFWPQRLRVYIFAEGKARTQDVRLRGATTRIKLPKAEKIDFLFANDGDRGYGQFQLDAQSRKYVLGNPRALRNDLMRAQVYEALWEDVRAAAFDPAAYIDLILARLPSERDDQIASAMLARLRTAMLRYLDAPRRAGLAPRVESFLSVQLRAADTSSRRIEYFRAYADLARGEEARGELKELLAGRSPVPGITLHPRDRFRMLQSLLTADDADAYGLLDQLSAADASSETRRYAFGAAAANPDPAVKRAIFQRLSDDPRLPEAWIEEAINPLNAIEHAAQTAPLLAPALALLQKLKRERKIFFVDQWLGGFIGGQVSRASLEQVERFLAEEKLDMDLRLKVLESLDTLERTVRVRERFSAPPATR